MILITDLHNGQRLSEAWLCLTAAGVHNALRQAEAVSGGRVAVRALSTPDSSEPHEVEIQLDEAALNAFIGALENLEQRPRDHFHVDASDEQAELTLWINDQIGAGELGIRSMS